MCPLEVQGWDNVCMVQLQSTGVVYTCTPSSSLLMWVKIYMQAGSSHDNYGDLQRYFYKMVVATDWYI